MRDKVYRTASTPYLKDNPAFLRLKEDEKLLKKERKKTNPDPIFIKYLENDILFLKKGLERSKEVKV